ncbi:MAG TPA: PLP-dependent aminotransferase family protein [Polyangiaceae bacterium]|nr:PLP-dependent aminotransferase family protein [Polyangiaceae bacterium]
MAFPLALGALEHGLSKHGNSPIFARIAELLSEEIRRGRLRPGDRLPGTRPLAEQLGVGRNTAVAAYAELAAEGWIVTRAAGGSFVSNEVPEQRARRYAKRVPDRPASSHPGFDFEARTLDSAHHSDPKALSLFAGVPDLRKFPSALLARAYRRALRGAGRASLDYTSPFGDPRLRAALAGVVATTRGLSVGPEQLLVTRGSQMALDLVARALVRPGDRVGVEQIGYQPAWAALRQAGAELVYLPVDKQGASIDALESALSSGPLRAVCLTPHHQYPTIVALSVGRRLRLLELAAKHRFAIIEDDYDHEFHYEGRPLASLASADRAGVVVYIGTLAKVLAPGLRLGFVAAPRGLIETLGALRFHVDRQGDTITERAVAELMEDGEVARHARRMRRLYHARRDAMMASLTRHLGSALCFDIPRGGMALWAEASPEIDTRGWLARAASHGVAFTLGSTYVAADLARRKARYYQQFLRLGFARYDERELETAVLRLARALRA